VRKSLLEIIRRHVERDFVRLPFLGGSSAALAVGGWACWLCKSLGETQSAEGIGCSEQRFCLARGLSPAAGALSSNLLRAPAPLLPPAIASAIFRCAAHGLRFQRGSADLQPTPEGKSVTTCVPSAGAPEQRPCAAAQFVVTVRAQG